MKRLTWSQAIAIIALPADPSGSAPKLFCDSSERSSVARTSRVHREANLESTTKEPTTASLIVLLRLSRNRLHLIQIRHPGVATSEHCAHCFKDLNASITSAGSARFR